MQRCQVTHDQKLCLVVIDDSGFSCVQYVCLILGRADIAKTTLGVSHSRICHSNLPEQNICRDYIQTFIILLWFDEVRSFIDR
jgi:hypothetical protein